MMSKRGISPIIATVLLLGFTVALATTVFLWMKGQTETLSESTVEYAEGEMQCQNVRINVVRSAGSILNVYNVGYLTINQLSIRPFAGKTFVGTSPSLHPQDSEMNLEPQSSQNKDCTKCLGHSGECKDCGISNCRGCGVINGIDPENTTACSQIEVMPIIQIQTRKVGCKDRTVMIEC